MCVCDRLQASLQRCPRTATAVRRCQYCCGGVGASVTWRGAAAHANWQV